MSANLLTVDQIHDELCRLCNRSKESTKFSSIFMAIPQELSILFQVDNFKGEFQFPIKKLGMPLGEFSELYLVPLAEYMKYMVKI